MTSTRRGFLRGAGLAVAAAGGATIPAAAQTEGDWPHWDAQPDHVTLQYSEGELLDHAPRLIFEQEAREKFMGLSGWTASSPDYDYDWHTYVAQFTHQEGISPFARLLSDSHLGDTEWYYVAADPDTGETERVVFDAYHWIAGRRTTSTLTMDGQHPVSRCVSPWHFYSHANTPVEDAVAIEEVRDLTARFDGMLENGLAEDLQPGTVVDPETMDIGGRNHWWKSTVGDWSKDAALASTVYSLGFAGADDADASALTL